MRIFLSAERSIRARCAVVSALIGMCAVSTAFAAVATQDAPTRRGVFSPPPSASSEAPPEVTRAPLDPAWRGGWLGTANLNVPGAAGGLDLSVALAVRIAPSGPMVRIWSLRAGAMDTAATDVVADGRALAFDLDLQGGRGGFELTLSDDATEAIGSLTFRTPQRRDGAAPAAPAGRVALKRVDIVSDLADTRVFAGTLDAGAQKIPMRLAVGEGPNGWCGSIDILVQGVRDFPVAVERTETGLTVRFSAGVDATIELSAAPTDVALSDWTALEGTFQQGAFAAPIRLALVEGVRAGALRRPQQPMPPFPYEVRDVEVAHPLGHVLAGTLTIPTERGLAVDGRVPALVCVSGSGPQDRDESLMGHKPFAVLADALTRAGVAVLRYDDRGTASSTGDFSKATTTDLASDADMAVEWLKRQPGIDPARVGLLGHSEGGLIGPIVAKWQNVGDAPVNPLAFLVLIAPPGERGGRVLTRQTRALTEAAGVTPEQLEEIMRAHEALMDEAIAGRPADGLRPGIANLLRAQLSANGQQPLDDAALRPLVEQTLLTLTNPWMSEFIRLDPRAALLWLEVPTFAVWGTLDLQVDASVNSAIFSEAAQIGGAPITVRVFEHLNHLMQPASKGTVEEYGEIELTIDPAALEEIVRWVVETARTVPTPQIPEASRPAEVRDAYVPPRLFEFRAPSTDRDAAKTNDAPSAPPVSSAESEKPSS